MYSKYFRHILNYNCIIYVLQLKWSDPDEEGLVKFLCGDRGFSEDRVRNGSKKLNKARSGTTQGRLDSFFTISSTPNKRKVS